MIRPSSRFDYAHGRRLFNAGGTAYALPSGAMKVFLRRSVSPSPVVLQRLPASVAAKQNGFWQIVS
jgi:hypothetical protein